MSRLRLPLTLATLVAALVAAGVAIGVAIGAPPPAAAEPVGQATLNAVSFQPLPAGTPMEVRVLDDSDENLAIRTELVAALEARGHTVAPDGPLILSIDTGDSVGAWRTTSDTDRVRMMDDRGRLFPQGELDVTRQLRFPLPRTTVVTPAQYRLGLTLDQRSDGVRVWQGWTIADLSQGEPSELARAMVPHLADTLGETVREQAFDLQ